MKKRFVILFIMCSITAFLLACAGSMPRSSDVLDEKAKNIKVPEDKALVYIIRPSTTGFAAKMNIFVDGKLVGKTHGKQYIYLLLNPGKHIVMSKSENEAEQILNLKAGQKYFLKQQVKMGFLKARTGLDFINNAEGYEMLQKCKLALNFSPTGEVLRE